MPDIFDQITEVPPPQDIFDQIAIQTQPQDVFDTISPEQPPIATAPTPQPEPEAELPRPSAPSPVGVPAVVGGFQPSELEQEVALGTARPLPPSDVRARELFAQQTARPEEYVEEVSGLERPLVSPVSLASDLASGAAAVKLAGGVGGRELIKGALRFARVGTEIGLTMEAVDAITDNKLLTALSPLVVIGLRSALTVSVAKGEEAALRAFKTALRQAATKRGLSKQVQAGATDAAADALYNNAIRKVGGFKRLRALKSLSKATKMLKEEAKAGLKQQTEEIKTIAARRPGAPPTTRPPSVTVPPARPVAPPVGVKPPIEPVEAVTQPPVAPTELPPTQVEIPKEQLQAEEAQRAAERSLAETRAFMEAEKQPRPTKTTTGAAQFREGDKFSVAGEQYDVKKSTSSEVVIEDGEKKTLDPTRGIIKIDGGVQGIERAEAKPVVPVPTEERAKVLEQKGFVEAAERLRKTVPPIAGEAGTVRIPKERAVPRKFKFADKSVEERFTAAQGVKKEPITAKAKQAVVSIKNKLTREYEHLPRTKEFAQLRFDLLKLSKQKGIASDKAIRAIRNITETLGREDYNLFTRKVVLNDLAEMSAEGKPLPFGFTKESLSKELTRLDSETRINPAVTEALNRRRQTTGTIKDDYISAMGKIGLNVKDRLSRKDYFRHQVLEYMNAKSLYGTGKKLKTPSYRGFLKKRAGSELDINTDYIQAEHEVLAQMIHDIQVADTIAHIDQNYNIAERVKADAKKKGLEDWHDAIPEGYVPWQAREGNVFYFADSIPANLAEQLTTGALEKTGISKDVIRKVLAVGKQRKELVVKEEIAETLDNLQITPSQNVISRANKEILRKWKVWTLISPRRLAKYNIRNMTGDADAVFIGNPSTFKKTPQATKELYNVFAKGEDMPQTMQDWFDRGGMSSTLQVQEMGELNKLKIFIDLQERKFKGKAVPMNLWKGYWKKARLTTDFRESILRYSAYLDYLEQMQASPTGTPKNFGGSIPDEIMGLQDMRDRAYFLSNDLLGAYDRISVMGRALREHLIPFWSWKELNFKRYLRFAQNAVNDGRTAEMVGKAALKGIAKTPYTAYRAGKFLIKATAFWAMLQAWNNTMFPEEERDLPTNKKSRPHIILGVDKDGKTITFDRIGVLGDFLEWFGLDAAPKYVDQWLRGKRTLKEIVKEMAESPVNQIVQGITPLAKIPAEVITRRGLFPDVFRPRTIRDRMQHVAGGLGLGEEYRAVFGKPSRGYTKSLSQALIYKSDALQSAYYGIMFEEKMDFLKKRGKVWEGFILTPRGDALYNYKMALRFKDKKAADKYFQEYLSLGGTQRGLKKSLKRMHPLSGLSKKDKREFVESLDNESKRKLEMATKFYNENFITF
jgi:hypothetical protein